MTAFILLFLSPLLMVGGALVVYTRYRFTDSGAGFVKEKQLMRERTAPLIIIRFFRAVNFFKPLLEAIQRQTVVQIVDGAACGLDDLRRGFAAAQSFIVRPQQIAVFLCGGVPNIFPKQRGRRICSSKRPLHLLP